MWDLVQLAHFLNQNVQRILQIHLILTIIDYQIDQLFDRQS